MMSSLAITDLAPGWSPVETEVTMACIKIMNVYFDLGVLCLAFLAVFSIPRRHLPTMLGLHLPAIST